MGKTKEEASKGKEMVRISKVRERRKEKEKLLERKRKVGMTTDVYIVHELLYCKNVSSTFTTTSYKGEENYLFQFCLILDIVYMIEL